MGSSRTSQVWRVRISWMAERAVASRFFLSVGKIPRSAWRGLLLFIDIFFRSFLRQLLSPLLAPDLAQIFGAVARPETRQAAQPRRATSHPQYPASTTTAWTSSKRHLASEDAGTPDEVHLDLATVGQGHETMGDEVELALAARSTAELLKIHRRVVVLDDGGLASWSTLHLLLVLDWSMTTAA